MLGSFIRKITRFLARFLIPQDIDEEAVKALLDTKVLKPQRGEEKATGQSRHQKSCQSEQKFNLLEKSDFRPKGCENRTVLRFQPQSYQVL